MRRLKIQLKFRQSLVFIVLLFYMANVNAQTDSLVLKNGNIIVGEIKSMDKGVLTIETNYSDKDFAIEWSGVKEIYTKSIFLITLSDGRRMNGSVQSIEAGTKVSIVSTTGEKIESSITDIVFLKGVKSNFWSRFSANIDVGLSVTKANNLTQLSANTRAGYLADKWQAEAYYNMLNSSQDSVETTKRIDGGLSYKYFLQRDWYLATSLNFLSNTEQALRLRTTGKLGGGKFLTHTNRQYWAAGAGLSFNNESFSNGDPKRNSLEAYGGSELNLFDIGDLNLLSSFYAYPSLTESGRWRTDFKFDAKYDLPLDFYIKLNLTWNYDNRPAIAGNQHDYVLAFSFGWEWD